MVVVVVVVYNVFILCFCVITVCSLLYEYCMFIVCLLYVYFMFMICILFVYV